MNPSDIFGFFSTDWKQQKIMAVVEKACSNVAYNKFHIQRIKDLCDGIDTPASWCGKQLMPSSKWSEKERVDVIILSLAELRGFGSGNTEARRAYYERLITCLYDVEAILPVIMKKLPKEGESMDFLFER